MKTKLQWLLLAGIIFTAASCGNDDSNDKPKLDLQVATNAVSEQTAFSAKVSGEVVGSVELSERGICWATSEKPTVDDEQIADVDPVEGEFVLKISGLEPATTYYASAYAKTTSGEVVYGPAKSFKTKDVVAESKSNSYVVRPDNVVVIPVARANDSSLGVQISSSDVLTAELLWMDNLDVITDVFAYGTGSAGNVIVMAGNMKGNAVVAVKVNNEIKWSWHIWVSEDAAQLGVITLPSGAKVMDRYLGATSKELSNAGAVGLQYQFGRKDAFTASATLGASPSEVLKYDLAGENPEIGLAEGPKNLAFATANPQTYIKSSTWGDWCTETLNDWWANDEGTKTLYDPCPQGWRVPSLADYAGLCVANFNASQQANDGGLIYIYNGHSTFFPYTGYREVTGVMDATAFYGTFWVNAPITGDQGINSALSPAYEAASVADVNGAPRARALSIRCLKE